MNSNYEALLALTRLGIGHNSALLSQTIDWQSVKDLAEKQGLSAVVLDGMEKLPDQQRPPKVFLLEWIGETLQGYEYRYEQYQRAIAELAGFYNVHGFKMMVLKGYACSINWPKPEHRPCGDIDIWLFGKQKDADVALAKEKDVEIDSSHHHHTVFYWGDFMVENHYDFVNVHGRKSSVEIEDVFKELGMDDSNVVEVNGEKVFLPSSNLHALFLVKHMVSHFASANISLRQVLDWAFYVKAHSETIDWNWLDTVLDEYHMREFYNCINAICVEELGFEAYLFHGVQFNPVVKEKVLEDVLEPKFTMEEPQRFISRLSYKYSRWKCNSWKRRLCFGESDWTMFWGSIRSHILKPTSI